MSNVRGRVGRLERARADVNDGSRRNPFDTLAAYLCPDLGPPVPEADLTDYERRLIALFPPTNPNETDDDQTA
jgi:hypothetical protein